MHMPETVSAGDGGKHGCAGKHGGRGCKADKSLESGHDKLLDVGLEHCLDHTRFIIETQRYRSIPNRAFLTNFILTPEVRSLMPAIALIESANLTWRRLGD